MGIATIDLDLCVQEPRSQHRHDDDREQEAREAEDDVHRAHDQVVRPAAEPSRERAEDRPDDDGEADRDEPHVQRHARSVHDAAVQVPGEAVESEKVLRPLLWAAQQMDARRKGLGSLPADVLAKLEHGLVRQVRCEHVGRSRRTPAL